MLKNLSVLSSSPPKGRSKKLSGLIAVCAAFLLTSGIPVLAADSYSEIKVNESQNGDTVHLSGNSLLTLELPCFVSGGYSWESVGEVPVILKNVSGTRDGNNLPEFVYLVPNGRPGDKMAQDLRFTGCNTGWCVLSFQQHRTWEKGKPPASTFKLVVHVDSPFSGSYLEPAAVPKVCYVPPPKSEVEVPGLPSRFSWRDSGWITPPKDQGQTGCCWAFGSTGVMEAQIMRYGNHPHDTVDCSEQFLVSCNPWNMTSANGGFYPMPMAIDYIATSHGQTDAGVVYESDLPFINTGNPDAVTVTTALPHHEKLKSWGYADEIADNPWPANEHFATTAQIKRAIWRYGPVATGVDDNWPNYTGGVAAFNTDAVNHIVMICGWNDDSSCFYVKNSWGQWGENGFLRVAYGTSGIGDNCCWASWNDSSYTGLDPNAVATGPATAYTGDTVTYSGTGSTYPGGSITSYLWRFGDGDTASGATVKHVFQQGGLFHVELTVVDNNGGFSGARVNTSVIDMTPTTPYGGTPWPVPDTIQAENYDQGGEGHGYHDVDGTNIYSQYRSDGVDIEACSDAGGGYDVASTKLGEWMKYTVNAVSGMYQFSVRTAIDNGYVDNAKIGLYADTARIGSVPVLGSGGWETFRTATCDTSFPLTAGNHALRLEIEGSATEYGNINWFSLQRVGDIVDGITSLTKKEIGEPLAVHGREVLWNLGTTGTADIRLFALNGRLISNIAQGTYQAGSHKASLSETLAPGMYLLQYRIGNVSRSVKVGIAE